MIDDLETFIAEQKAKLSKEKQELKTEPRTSTNQEGGRKKWNIPSNDQFNIMPMPGTNENFHLKPPTPEAGIVNKLGAYADKRQKLQEERRDEYNRFLAGQNFVRGANPKQTSFSSGPPQDDSFGASLPGLRNHPSAEMRKMAERNREYNEMLRNQRNLQESTSTRKGYESPVLSYEEILRRKRNEEKKYRRHNDPEYYDPKPNLTDSQKPMSSSEGNLSQRPQQEDPRFTQQQYEPKKVKFGGSSQLPNGSANVQHGTRSRRVDPNTEHYNATLLIGERLNDDPHKKEAYRKELLRQMAEAKALREREHLESKQVLGNIIPGRNHDRRPMSWPTDEVTSGRPAGARAGVEPGAGPGPGARPGANQMPAIPQSYLGQQKPQFDENLPRNAYKIDGILANGFEFDLSRPLYHQPVSAPSGIPLQAVPSLLPYNSQINDAYFYYANQNPLDPNLGTGPAAAAVPLVVPSHPLPIVSALQQPRNEVDPRPTYSRRKASVERPAPGTFGFDNDDDRKQANEEKKRLYQQELQKQITEDKLKKLKEEQEKERYEKKLEEEIANYNPFGRGGGGAPVKDVFGNVVTSRNLGSLVHHEPRPVVTGFADSQRTARSDPTSLNSDLYRSPFKEAEKSANNFARGGHGIFGEPMTQEQKNSKLKYQEELRMQMEEKRLQKEKEKEKVKREDELREQRIREDAMKAAQESEEAARKEREKQEQLKQDQLAVKLKAEERKRLEEQRKKEEEEAERDRLRREEEDRRQRKELHRPRSPPINSAFDSRHNENQDRTVSPPIPTKRTQSRQSHGSNPEALERLANFAKKLQVDRKNVERQRIESQPEVYDPRIVLRPQNAKQNYINVFELAKAGRPASVRRGPAAKDPSNRQTFNNRYSNLSDDLVEPLSDSDADAFEKRQRAVIKAQNKELAELNKENSKRYDSDLSPAERPSSNLLKSTTDYLAFPLYDLDEGAQFLPRDMEQRRPPNQKMERLEPLKRTNSETSLVLELRQKNKERLRKLKSLAGDDLSSDDPEDMLEKFMLQQTRRRPPSSDTHNDYSWMLPSTGH